MQTIKAIFVAIFFTSFILGSVAAAVIYSEKAAAETAALESVCCGLIFS